MSYSPQTRLFYATGGHGAWWYRRVDNPYVFIPNRIPGQTEYGILAAIDSRTNKIVWQHRTKYSLVGGGGALTTAGGLLFHLLPEGVFQALDAKTGALLWEFQTGYVAGRTPVSLGGGAPAITYEVNGKQHVAVTSGRGLWAFALEGPLGPRPAAPPPPTRYPFGGLIEESPAEETPEVSIGVLMNTGTPKQYWNEWGFRPVRVRVKAGTSVRWTNHGTTPHTITTDDGAWSTGPIRPGGSGAVRFDKPGTYTYICKDHPWSLGELTVVP
jgi:plastocyanin